MNLKIHDNDSLAAPKTLNRRYHRELPEVPSLKRRTSGITASPKRPVLTGRVGESE